MMSDEVNLASPFPGHEDCLGLSGIVWDGGGGDSGDNLATLTGSLDSILGSSQTPHAPASGASTATSSRRGTLERGEAGQDGANSKDEICFDFTKGLCTRGDKCKFTHDLATIVSVNSREKGICFDFLRPSGCHRGLLCRFSHDLSSIQQQCAQQSAQSGCSEGAQASSAGGKTNKAICFDFVKGVCERGPDCRYSHDLSLIARTGRGGPQNQKTQEVCHDFLRGRCDRGSACKYSHNTSLLAPPPPSSTLPLAASAPHPSRPYNFSPDGLPLDLLDPAMLGGPPGSPPIAASHPMHHPGPPAALFGGHPLGGGGAGAMPGVGLRGPPAAAAAAALLGGAAIPPLPHHPWGPGPPAAHHVPFLPMHRASGYEPSIPLHLQHPGSYMRHHPHHPHPLHHPQGHPHDSAALAHSHAAVLRHLAVLQQHNQLAAAAASSAPFQPPLYPMPSPMAPPPAPGSHPWLADAVAAKAAASQPSPMREKGTHAGAAVAAAAAAHPPQQPSLLPQPERAPLGAQRDMSNTLQPKQPERTPLKALRDASNTPQPQQQERAPLGALRDVSNTLHQHPSSNTPAANQKLQQNGATTAKAAGATAKKSGHKASAGPAATESAPVSRLGSYSSSNSSSVMGSLRTASPFPDAAAVAPAESSGDVGVGSIADAPLPPTATAISPPLAHGAAAPFSSAPLTREGRGPAVWPLPHAAPHAAPRLLGNSTAGGDGIGVANGGGSPLSVEAISAALAGVGNDPRALAHALSSLAAMVQAQAESASSPSVGQHQGPLIQQHLARFLGASPAVDDDLLGAKDQQLCGPPPPAPLHAFATGFGRDDYSSSPLAGYGDGPLSISPSQNPLLPVSCTQKADADAGDDGFTSLAPDLLPLLQEIWNK
ncbi:hypothetical protein DUNSADRAFT_5327 [Dunaliella salina]|uniref:C3H1-type domain-containing protein n=1 Tax=Dunaliella salina TaxID=3046 RepID=A0ABQ7GQF5_DUNSA|nr:hypothetical protein DUNSADRAFT_5327 [Dunaliella salina]|eukprot:KAF5836836.1 hypothetical protein DUNSADRAFT_5327 [Dunaliella salina]